MDLLARRGMYVYNGQTDSLYPGSLLADYGNIMHAVARVEFGLRL